MPLPNDLFDVPPLAQFANALSREHQDQLRAELVVRECPAGSRIARKGKSADSWFGILTGTVKIQVTSWTGRETMLATFSNGCLFGEGTLLKGEPWPFDAIALHDSTLVVIPASSFLWMLNSSLPFNRFLIDQLNSRLGQFISRCEHARLHQTDQHVAHCLAELFDPRLYPLPARPRLRMSQEEIGHLAGVSRAIVNRTLHDLSRSGIVRVSYGVIELLDGQGLRRFSESRPQ